MKKQLVQFNIPGMTAKLYDKAWEELRKAGQTNPSGLLHHVGAQQGNNWVVVDVWESVDAFNTFGKTLMPILEKLGLAVDQVKPVVTPVHFEYTGVEEAVL